MEKHLNAPKEGFLLESLRGGQVVRCIHSELDDAATMKTVI